MVNVERRRRQRLPLEDRLWFSVSKSDDCWEWTGACFPNGYGHIVQGGKHLLTHRVSYELAFGAVPDGLCVLHRCDNRRCVRPDHLFLGTHQENMDDMRKKGRSRHQKLRQGDYSMIARLVVIGFSARDIAKTYGVSPNRVRQIARSCGAA